MSQESNDRQKRLIGIGLCRYHVTREAEPGTTFCAECNAKRRETARRSYHLGRAGTAGRGYRCRACGEPGHNARTCPNKPATTTTP